VHLGELVRRGVEVEELLVGLGGEQVGVGRVDLEHALGDVVVDLEERLELLLGDKHDLVVGGGDGEQPVAIAHAELGLDTWHSVEHGDKVVDGAQHGLEQRGQRGRELVRLALDEHLEHEERPGVRNEPTRETPSAARHQRGMRH
jgi:hypothetical protein